jgi:RNA polymerase sigma factor (sigma-70 family)
MADAARQLIHQLRALVDPARHEKANDGQLLARWAADHDAHAFAALVWRHGPLVWRVSRSLLHQTQDAEDAFQATFLILARKAGRLKRGESIAGWLYQTAYKLALQTRRTEARRAGREAKATSKIGTDPLEDLTVREARSILTEELQQLPAMYRDPLVLCFYEGATHDEAARQLGCARSTVVRRLDRGRALLARRLTKRGLAPASALTVTLWSGSAVSGRLVEQTITAAKCFALGNTLTGTAAGLAQGVLRTLVLKKLAVSLVAVLAAGGLTVGARFVHSTESPAPATPQAQVAIRQPLNQAQSKPKEEAPRLDRYGDPLPPGAVNRLGSLRFRHGDRAFVIAYTQDGKCIVSGGAPGTLRLWDAATGKLKWQLDGEADFGYTFPALVVSDDGKTLALLTTAKYLLVDSATGKKLVEHNWPKGRSDDSVRTAAIAPDLSKFALGCVDGTVRLYDAATGQEQRRIAAGEKAANDFPWCMAFFNDSKTLYVGVFHRADEKVEVKSFDTQTGKLVNTLPFKLPIRSSLEFSKDFQLLAAFGWFYDAKDNLAGQLVIWDVAARKLKHTTEIPKGVSSVAFSPDNKLVAIGDSDIQLLETDSGKEIRRLGTQGHFGSLKFAPDGKTLAGANGWGGSITLWDVASGTLQTPSPEPMSDQQRVRFLSSDKQLLTVGSDGASWWNTSNGQRIHHLPTDANMEHCFGLSPDGKLIARRGADKGDFALVDVATGKPVRKLEGHKSWVENAVFSPDGTKLYSAGGFDPRVIVWDVATGKLLQELQSHTVFVDHVAISPDGKRVASWATDGAAKGDYDIRLWDVGTGKLERRLTPRRGSAFEAIFSVDSSRMVTVGGDPGRPNNSGEVQLWGLATGTEMRSFVGHNERVICAAMTADGRMIATSSIDSTFRLWEVASGAERGRILGHHANVASVDFSQNGRLLAAASTDAPIYIWDAYAVQKSQYPPGKLAEVDQAKLWKALADADAAKAFQAICELIARPAEAVPIVENGWKSLPRATVQQMQKWIDDLDSKQFPVRDKATAELQRYGFSHEALLSQARDKASSLELRRRLDQLLDRQDPEKLRRTRMLEVLERIGIGPARRLLQEFADQAEDTELSREAGAGLKRF